MTASELHQIDYIFIQPFIFLLLKLRALVDSIIIIYVCFGGCIYLSIGTFEDKHSIKAGFISSLPLLEIIEKFFRRQMS